MAKIIRNINIYEKGLIVQKDNKQEMFLKEDKRRRIKKRNTN